jgi:hypothetical protein
LALIVGLFALKTKSIFNEHKFHNAYFNLYRANGYTQNKCNPLGLHPKLAELEPKTQAF